MRWRLIGIASLVVLASYAGGGARAAKHAAKHVAATIDTPARRLAATAFKHGKQLYASGDYASALDAFQKGFDAYPLRGFLVNIAQCQRRLGHLKDAAAAYQQFLDGAGAASPLRVEVEEALAEVRAAQREIVEAAPPPERPAVVEATPAVTPTPAQAAAAPALAPTPVGATLTEAIVAHPPQKRRSRAWVWAVVGVSAAAVAGGVATGVVLGLRAGKPSGGSLGLIDGRTP